MKRNFFRNELLAGLLLVAMGGGVTTAFADGTETLGPPSIPIAEGGTGIVAAGVGLCDQCDPPGDNPGEITINVPGNVQQALLYWHGGMNGNVAGPDTVLVNSIEVTGTLIGGPTNFFGNVYDSAFRADITDLVDPGPNTLTVDLTDPGFDQANLGAGVLVIFDDGTTSGIELRDGQDLAFVNFDPPLDTTVPQAFTFDPSSVARTADLTIFSGSAEDGRNSIVRVTVDGKSSDFDNELNGVDGPQWDTLTVSVEVPAGADMLTVQLTSGPGSPAQSLSWIAAGLSLVEPEQPPPSGVTRTLGYWKGHPTVIDGSFDGPGGFPSLLPLSFCGEDIDEPCDAVAFLQSKGGGINNFMRQGMAALLNCQAFDCASEISALIEDGSAACATGASFDFGGAGDDLDLFNKSGDNLELPFQSPSAQPKFCE